MKLVPLPLFVLIVGCASKSPYDISSADLTKHRIVRGRLPDLNHLPKDVHKTEHVYNKGDTLPDGSIAPGEVHTLMISPNQEISGSNR